MIRVLIADDHYLVRQGILALLQNTRDIEVVGQARDGEEVLQLARELLPDVIVMDISMPRLDGIAATSKIQDFAHRPSIVVLSMYGNPALVERAVHSGAHAYLLKRSTAGELVPAVRAAHQGRLYLGSNISLDESAVKHPDSSAQS